MQNILEFKWLYWIPHLITVDIHKVLCFLIIDFIILYGQKIIMLGIVQWYSSLYPRYTQTYILKTVNIEKKECYSWIGLLGQGGFLFLFYPNWQVGAFPRQRIYHDWGKGGYKLHRLVHWQATILTWDVSLFLLYSYFCNHTWNRSTNQWLHLGFVMNWASYFFPLPKQICFIKISSINTLFKYLYY